MLKSILGAEKKLSHESCDLFLVEDPASTGEKSSQTSFPDLLEDLYAVGRFESFKKAQA